MGKEFAETQQPDQAKKLGSLRERMAIAERTIADKSQSKERRDQAGFALKRAVEEERRLLADLGEGIEEALDSLEMTG